MTLLQPLFGQLLSKLWPLSIPASGHTVQPDKTLTDRRRDSNSNCTIITWVRRAGWKATALTTKRPPYSNYLEKVFTYYSQAVQIDNTKPLSSLMGIIRQHSRMRTSEPIFHTTCNVTRLGNLLDFGQLFKAFGNN